MSHADEYCDVFELNCGESWEDAFGGECPPHIEALAFALPRDFAGIEAAA